jgi:hypothetical protein
MKERGLRSRWGTESVQTRVFHNQHSDEEEEPAMDRQYVGIEFHRRRSVNARARGGREALVRSGRQ